MVDQAKEGAHSNGHQVAAGITVGGTRPALRKPIELTDNARTVLEKRYLRKNSEGKPAETVEEMFWRVAWNVAGPEDEYSGERQAVAEQFFHMLTAREFFPNSPTFTGAGTPLGQLAACFVLAIEDDMGREPQGIFQTLRNAALIQQTGGGNGFSFSRLRPKGARVSSSNGTATGPIGFLRVFDQAFGEIAQGGSRRGANMAVLRVDHPDVRDFITCKADENQITNFNISVGITDEFMQAVKDDGLFELKDPTSGDAWEVVHARELYDLIVQYAHHNGEPGMLFLDAANRDNPVPHLYQLEATNPCGEQWLGPYENCCLGSVNLAAHVTDDGRVDWAKLQRTVELATRFLDDVVDANAYVPAVPELAEAAARVRRIGLGIMGLGDMMYSLGVRYGSEEGQEFAGQVMEFVHYHSMKTSVELAEKRGPFLAYKGSLYDPENLQWKPPTPLTPYTRDWGRPSVDWAAVEEGIRAHSIRNGAQTTIAPTGTISTVAGCEGYGCEPVFALAYTRYFMDGDERRELQYTSPTFEKALLGSGLDAASRQRIVDHVTLKGTCQDMTDIPDSIRHPFVVASDITPEEHVRTQAALQRFVSNSISKTINFPSTAEESDVADSFMTAWELGAKGLTVYVAGSRDKVVLETKETAQKRDGVEEAPAAVEAPIPAAEPQMTLFPESKKPRSYVLPGYTYRIQTPLGTTFVTVNENGGGEPFEVFMHTSKAGSETAAVSEAMGRLLSYLLRMSSPVPPSDRVTEIVKQLSGIGGDRPLGLGPNKVRSLPDGVAQVLAEYIDQRNENGPADKPRGYGHAQPQLPLTIADAPKGTTFGLCPSCGQASLVREEGCVKCYSCGYSEC